MNAQGHHDNNNIFLRPEKKSQQSKILLNNLIVFKEIKTKQCNSTAPHNTPEHPHAEYEVEDDEDDENEKEKEENSDNNIIFFAQRTVSIQLKEFYPKAQKQQQAY